MPGLSRRQVLVASGVMSGSLAAGLGFGALRSDATTAVPPDRQLPDEDGYDLWLRYRLVEDAGQREAYANALGRLLAQGGGANVAAAKDELVQGLTGLLGVAPTEVTEPRAPGTLVVGVWADSPVARQVVTQQMVDRAGAEGYVLASGEVAGVECTVVTARTGAGVVRGAFHMLRLAQTRQPISDLDVVEHPVNGLRVVNHWDNLNGTVERGYAGGSIFDWERLPDLDPRYVDYARALASLGINGTVVNNVNASSVFLSSEFLPKLVALADVLRPYGVRLYVSAYFDSPADLDPDIPDGDPDNPDVPSWWSAKASEIYAAIPDFGGWLVKAGTEGQPGPIEYDKTHAEGANMFARALAPHGGVVIYRAFVHEGPDTWTEDAWNQFTPHDGEFDDNAVVQIKNGPMDFNPREPVNALLGGLPNTNSMIELQITQEYTGHSTHLCYLVPQWKEVLDFDTHAAGEGSYVRDIVAGSTFGYGISGFAGVINFGTDRSWTGHQLAAANTHGYGRLAWNPTLSAEALADEWVTMTFGPDRQLRDALTSILLDSWQAYLDYTEVLGQGYLVHGLGDHFAPDLVASHGWHRSDADGTGFDRTTATGSGYLGFYADPVTATYESLETCPDELLLFFHHVPYTHQLRSGSSVIAHIYDSHFAGLRAARELRTAWQSLADRVDAQRHAEVAERFDQQVFWATVWRDTIIGYFLQLSGLLDGSHTWLQVDLPAASSLLIGGQENDMVVNVGNATPDQVTTVANLDAPSGWTAEPGTLTLGSTEFGNATIRVTPPAPPAIVDVALRLDTDHEVVGSRPRTITVTPAADRCVLALDGGTESSAVLDGYTRLSPADAWDAARGFGWVGAAPQSRDRGGDAFRADFCNDSTERVLRVTVPAGVHDAYLLVGDRTEDSFPTIVTANGTELARSEWLAANEYVWLSFPLDGGTSGSTLDLHLSSIPGEHWHLAGFVLLAP